MKRAAGSGSREVNGQSAKANAVRIIAGRWRGRKLAFADAEGLRPTGDRIRETLFSWLQPVLPGATCLDLFAGSGALGFEALSRGAARVVMVEKQPAAVRCLRDSQRQLAAENCVIEAMDAAAWLASRAAAYRFDIVFLDPPFADASIRVPDLLAVLQAADALSPSAWCYLEQSQAAPLPVLPGWRLHRDKRAGQVRYTLWQREPAAP